MTPGCGPNLQAPQYQALILSKASYPTFQLVQLGICEHTLTYVSTQYTHGLVSPVTCPSDPAPAPAAALRPHTATCAKWGTCPRRVSNGVKSGDMAVCADQVHDKCTGQLPLLLIHLHGFRSPCERLTSSCNSPGSWVRMLCFVWSGSWDPLPVTGIMCSVMVV